MPALKPTAILLIQCPDRPGLVAAVTGFLLRLGGNVVDLDEHVDREAGVFFMRVEWELQGFALAKTDIGPAFAAQVPTIPIWSRWPAVSARSSALSRCRRKASPPRRPRSRPYHSAHARGVKIIGATSHYVTEALDAGPIIDQGVGWCLLEMGRKKVLGSRF